MPLKLNPFTAQFDLTGSGGGGGASYIDGEVATYADLPLDGSSALNSAWLVRTASGVWPVSRKQAGIYIRTATGGSNRDSDYTYAGTMPDVFSDSQFLLYDNSDTSKNLAFDLGGITTGTTRTLTAPNASGRIQVEGQPIGNTTPAAGTFTTLNATNGTLTASAPVLDLAQTWNNAAVTFTGFRANITDTASAAASNILDLQSGGTSAMRVDRTGRVIIAAGGASGNGNGAIAIGSGGGGFYQRQSGGLTFTGGSFELSSTGVNIVGQLRFGLNMSSIDSTLVREAANELALRGNTTTNPQTFRLYNTTDAGLTNYERGFMRWNTNVLQIGTEKAGTGSARALEFQTDGVTRMTIAATGGNINMGTSAVFGANGLQLDSSVNIRFSASTIGSSSDLWILRSGSGIMRISTGSGDNDFNRLQFGGTTNAYPALKRSSTALQVRLADDSAYSVLDAQLRAQGTAPATSGAAGTAGDIRYDADYIYVCTAASTWKRAAIATW